jgi:hypothetical protein
MVPGVASSLSETIFCMNRFGHFVSFLKPKKLTLPGPKGLPVIGNIHQVDSSQMEKTCTNWSKIHGKLFQFKMFRKPVVVISDADLLRQAFTSQSLHKHLNDRSENATSHVFKGRRHVGFADLNEKTDKLRNVLRIKVLQYQMKDSHFQKCTLTALENFLVQCKQKSNTDINPDVHLKELLSDLLSIMVS